MMKDLSSCLPLTGGQRHSNLPIRFNLFLTPFLLSLALAFQATAQLGGAVHGVAFGESLEVSRQKLRDHAEKWILKEVETPNFPLAKDSEMHLVGQGFSVGGKEVDEIVFTFSDDKLTFIEARGGAVEAFSSLAEMQLDTLMDYVASFPNAYFSKPDEEAIWLLSKEALHPNLFTWSNPYLPSSEGSKTDYESSAAIPDLVELGASLEKLRPLLEAGSTFTYEQALDGSDPNAQLQINGFGIEYAGFPRKMEARFGDGQLNMVWILTGKQEEDRVRKALVSTFGEAEWSNENWEVFNKWEVLLRKDKPEVLLVAEGPRSMVKEWVKSGK